MPLTQEVSADVTIAGADLTPTSVETSTTATTQANTATITGYMDDPTQLSRDQSITIEVNNEVIFIGNLKHAVQRGDGELSIDAYGTFADIHTKVVGLEMQAPLFINTIARNLLRDAFGPDSVIDRFGDPDTATPGSIYVAGGSLFPNGDTLTQKMIGPQSESNSLTDVLKDLADSIAGIVWVDRRNVLRFEPAPKHQSWIANNIIEAEVGDETNEEDNVAKVIVNTASGAVGGNAAESYIYSTFASNAEAEHDDLIAGLTIQELFSRTHTINDNNIITQEEANNVAGSVAMSSRMASNSGTLTFVGTTDLDPWDVISVPQFDEIPLVEGTYTVRSVRHVIDSTNGWTTEAELGPEIDEIAANISQSGDAASAIADIFTSNRSDGGQITTG